MSVKLRSNNIIAFVTWDGVPITAFVRYSRIPDPSSVARSTFSTRTLQDALQLVICYLYQDAGVFDKPKPETSEADRDYKYENASFSGNTGDAAQSEPNRARDRRDRLFSIRSKAGVTDEDDEQLKHGTAEMSMNPWDEGDEGEHETAAGFGSFGGAYGGNGKYDGAGLDRLMRLMAAARTLKLTRLQVGATSWFCCCCTVLL